jgi:hypothetical protein
MDAPELMGPEESARSSAGRGPLFPKQDQHHHTPANVTTRRKARSCRNTPLLLPGWQGGPNQWRTGCQLLPSQSVDVATLADTGTSSRNAGKQQDGALAEEQ